jgi:RNA recognition motif-containing protein
MLFRRFTLITYFTQASSDKKQLDVGANLFIGNLDENVDERLLYDTFSAFGMMATTAKVRSQYAHNSSSLTEFGRLHETLARGFRRVMASSHIPTLSLPMPQQSL